MKNLTLSLILVVVTAVIGLGWLITEIRYRNGADDAVLSDELAAYQRFGKELALALDETADKQGFIQRWQTNSAYAIRLQDRTSLPVPDELQADFANSGALILQSDKNISLHFLLPQSEQVLSLTIPDSAESDTRSLTNLILTIAFYACVIVILLLWLYPLLKRLMELNRMARDFGSGNLASRIAPSRFSYIDGIELEVNRMADRIQTLVNDNKLLSRAVSHNLKTPLARLRFGIDMLDETSDTELRKKYSARINRDLDEMEALVETLLQYAKLDEASVQLQKQTMELSAFVRQLFADIAPSAVKILYELTETDTAIAAEPNYLAMQLNNLMDNALKHAREIIVVTVATSPGSVMFTIEDDGAGIPESERADVIKPFWRGKQDREIAGHGMGLAIVAKIADWFGAALIITRSERLGGAALQLCFRKNADERLN